MNERPLESKVRVLNVLNAGDFKELQVWSGSFLPWYWGHSCTPDTWSPSATFSGREGWRASTSAALFFNKKNASALKNVGAVMEVWLVSKTKNKQREKKHKTSVTVAWIFIALSKFISHIWALESSLESHLCVSWGSRKKNITGFLEKNAFTSWAWNLMKLHPILVVFPCIRVDFVAL